MKSVANKQYGTQQCAVSTLTEGFPFRSEIIPWGTTEEDLNGKGYVVGSSSRVQSQEGVYFGVPIAAVSICGRYPKRPITDIWYSIEARQGIAHIVQVRELQNHFVGYFGKCERSWGGIDHLCNGSASSVPMGTVWQFGAFELQVSWYGHTRKEDGWDACGFLSIDWLDEAAIARPYVDEWKKRQERLNGISPIRICSIKCDNDKYGGYRWQKSVRQKDFTDEQELMRRIIRAPSILTTPLNFCNIQDHSELVLWKSASLEEWGVSSMYTTVVGSRSTELHCNWSHLLRYRGPGYESLAFSHMQSRRWLRNNIEENDDIKLFFEQLRQLPNVTYTYSEYYND